MQEFTLMKVVGLVVTAFVMLVICTHFFRLYAVRSSSKQRCQQAGFTLIELLVTIAILGMLATIGAGSWNDYRERTKVDSAKEYIVSVFQQARLKAFSSGQREVVTLDWAANAVNGNTLDTGVDLQKIVCPVGTLTNTGTFDFNFSRRGTGVSGSLRVSSDTLPESFIIVVNGTTGRVSVKDGC